MEKNKRYLLDAHAFIWWMENNRRLNENIKTTIDNPLNTVFLSAISVWEMIIKKRLGKLKLPKTWKKDIKSGKFQILPMTLEHALAIENLSLHHKDPFDRMLVAQAKVEKLTIITIDPKIKKYKIKTIGI